MSLASCSSIFKLKGKLRSELDTPTKERNPFYAVWIKNLDPSYSSGNLPIGTGSPFMHEDHLYMGDLSGYMRAYDIEKGVLVWEKKESEAINAKASNFEDSIIYGTMSGRLYSRNYLTGKLDYAIDLGSPIESEPVESDGRLYIHLRNHKIISLDAKTGKIIWGYKRSVPFTTTLQRVSKVYPYKNKLLVGFADGNILALSKEEGIVFWEQKISSGLKFVDVDASPIAFNNYIVAGSANDKLKFIDPENGIIKKTIGVIAGHTPVITNSELVVGSIYGDIYRVNSDGVIKKKVKLSKDGISSVVKWGNGFAVSTVGDKLFYVNDELDIRGEFSLGHSQSAVFGFLQVKDGYLATYSSRNRLYVFKQI